ncbi:hypothetical protein N657DRAFT_635885 [Parathielavia appendiculata]|uniref:Uncharacterized protein n=1 Tax=Parathielavia appendiculata TaxID=2587402 RepID=A0AAN6TW91_9PEZI|nr:hypothetical protein N657DRAFT_635885 [Parathielavia appendiculata]
MVVTLAQDEVQTNRLASAEKQRPGCGNCLEGRNNSPSARKTAWYHRVSLSLVRLANDKRPDVRKEVERFNVNEARPTIMRLTSATPAEVSGLIEVGQTEHEIEANRYRLRQAQRKFMEHTPDFHVRMRHNLEEQEPGIRGPETMLDQPRDNPNPDIANLGAGRDSLQKYQQEATALARVLTDGASRAYDHRFRNAGIFVNDGRA